MTGEIISVSAESVKLAEGNDGELSGTFESVVEDNRGTVYYNGSLDGESINAVFYFVL